MCEVWISLPCLRAAPRWDAVWEILGRHPTYVNRRPDYRRYSAVHQAALFGDVGVLRRLVEECGADPRALTADGTTAQHVAAEHGHGEAAEFLEQCALEYAKKRSRAEAACPAGAASMEAANRGGGHHREG
ncbi:unnamed protein product [Prorocentrum cordatum]|uniref:Uncharacterized protein n=1 Tax=Prorocentrum cordatum TaxID=2364126 RepID=A0ABN9SUM1_9DINO|nr:unnamed protein product [Polarella glacialis]